MHRRKDDGAADQLPAEQCRFLQKTIGKLTADHQQKLDAANRQIEGLKATVAGLQRAVGELQATQTKAAEDSRKKADMPAAKDNAPAKDGGK